MADYRILFEADTAQAERDTKRLEKVADAAARDRKLGFTVPSFDSINKGFERVGKGAEDAANNIRLIYKTSKSLPGVGGDIQQFENIFRGVATGAGIAAGAIAANNTAGKALGNIFKGVGDTIEGLVGRFAMLGFAITGIGKTVELLRSAFGGLFNETIGREIKLRETMLSTQTAVASMSKVFVGGNEITDPLQKIEALGGAIESRVESIRERSLDLAGVTSDQVIDVFNITASQIGMIGGGLKEAEDLAIQFSAALGTFGIPLYQANQEIGSILRGDINQDSLLAKKLGITNEDIANAKNQVGGVMKFLEDKLKTAVAGQKLQAQTWSGVTSNLKELQELIGQKFGKGLLDPLLAGLSTIYKWLSSIKKEVFGIAESAGKTVGNLLRIASVRLTNGIFGGAGSGDQITSLVKSGAASLQSVAQSVFAWLGKAATYAFNAILQAFNALKPALGILADSVRVLIKAFAEIKAAQFEGLVSALANVISILSPLISLAAGFVRVWAGILDLPIVQYFSSVTAQLNLFKRAGGDVLINMVGLISFMRSTGIPVLQFLFKAFASVVTGVGNAIKAFGQLNITLAGFASGMAAAVAVVSRGAAQLVGYFTQIGANTTKVSTSAVGVSTAVGRLVTAISAFGSSLQQIFAQLSTALAATVGRLGSTIGPGITALRAGIASLSATFTEVVRSVAGVGAAFLQLRTSVGALVGSIAAPFIALGRAVLQAATQLYTVLQPALVKLQAALTQAGIKADELAAKLTRVAGAANGAGKGMMGMVMNFAKGMASFLAFQLLIGVAIDAFGRFQQAQQRAAEQKEVAEAMKYLEANATKAARGMDDLTKATYDYNKALVETRRNSIVEEIAKTTQQIKIMEQQIARLAKEGGPKTLFEKLFGFNLPVFGGKDFLSGLNAKELAAKKAALEALRRELEKILKLTQQQAAEDAKARANSPQGQAERIQKEAKRHAEVLALQEKQAQNYIKQAQNAGLLTIENAKILGQQQELFNISQQIAAKRSEIARIQTVNPTDVDTIRKLNTELAELEGRQIDIQISINKEQFERDIAELKRQTDIQIGALERQQQINQSNLSVNQARAQVENEMIRLSMQRLDIAEEDAKTSGERLRIIEQRYNLQLRLNNIEYEGAIANIQASIKEAEISEKILRIKLLSAQAEEALARARGQWNKEYANAVRIATEAYNIQVRLTQNVITVAGYQKQVAEYQRTGANLTAKQAYDSARIAENTRNSAKAADQYASAMEEAARAAQGVTIQRNGLQPWMEQMVRQAKETAIKNAGPDPFKAYIAGVNAEIKMASYFNKILGDAEQQDQAAQKAEFEKKYGPIPQFASGGLVTRPTLAMIGEGGEREYVVPESKMADVSARYLSAYSSGAATTASSPENGAAGINIQTGPVLDFNGERYVTINDFERGLRQVATSMYRGLRTPAGRYATGIR